MATIGAILLGIIDIAIVAALLLLIGAVIKWGLKLFFGVSMDAQIERLYLALVGLICLYMLVALLFGLPRISIVGPDRPAPIIRTN